LLLPFGNVTLDKKNKGTRSKNYTPTRKYALKLIRKVDYQGIRKKVFQNLINRNKHGYIIVSTNLQLKLNYIIYV